MHRSAHTDSFARDNLPPQDAWPDIDLSNFDYGAQLNAAVELTDEMVAKGFGDHVALIGNGRRRSYKESEFARWTWPRAGGRKAKDYCFAPEEVWAPPAEAKHLQQRVQKVHRRRPGALALYMMCNMHERSGFGRAGNLEQVTSFTSGPTW